VPRTARPHAPGAPDARRRVPRPCSHRRRRPSRPGREPDAPAEQRPDRPEVVGAGGGPDHDEEQIDRHVGDELAVTGPLKAARPSRGTPRGAGWHRQVARERGELRAGARGQGPSGPLLELGDGQTPPRSRRRAGARAQLRARRRTRGRSPRTGRRSSCAPTSRVTCSVAYHPKQTVAFIHRLHRPRPDRAGR
jgi:hypothetical protein